MNPPSSRRFLILSVALGIWGLLLIGRLVQIQILRGPSYRARARQQQERTIAVDPRRGAIVDREGRELAVSVEAQSIFAVPEKVEDAKLQARSLAKELGLPEGVLREKLTGDRSFVWIARKVSDDAAARIRAMHLPGIDMLPEARRFYPSGELAASVLGYVGLDGHGLAGAEYQYDGLVRGRPGEMRVSCDARQSQYQLSPLPGREAVEGSSLQLTLDRDLQFVAERELAAAIAETGARDGSVVLLDPSTGDVFAIASFPAFDPNRYAAFSSNSWRNRAIADAFEPGSVFKVISGAAVIDAGVATPADLVDCGQGSIQVGNWVIHDAEHERFGVIPFADVIARSSNVGMVRVGLRLGPERLYSAARAFGIGRATGIDLPGESTGILRETSQWSALSNASISYGQEVSVTPLQLAVALAAIANGGYRVTPTVMLKTIDPAGVEAAPPKRPAERVISAQTAAAMNEVLKRVVAEGTGKKAAVSGYIVAGKTGTAQKAVGHGYSRDKFVATFAGYAPAENPRVVAVVSIDEPRGQYFASEVAAPVFGRILSRAMDILKVPADGSSVREPAAQPAMIARAAPHFAPGVEPAALHREPSAVSLSRMPDLAGYSARRALAELSKRGLAPKLSGSGFVVEQAPAAGSVVEPGQGCDLRLVESPSP